jgi:hypothetical protein
MTTTLPALASIRRSPSSTLAPFCRPARQPSRFLPAFLAAAHRLFAASASRFRAAALIGFLFRLPRVGAAPSGAAGAPSLCLSSPILTVISLSLCRKPIKAASRNDLSTVEVRGISKNYIRQKSLAGELRRSSSPRWSLGRFWGNHRGSCAMKLASETGSE